MTRSEEKYDLVVLGGGTAGLVSTAVAAALGARVALVERDRLGGECLWTGCVPSKALLASARAAALDREGARYGLARHDADIDSARVLESVRSVRERVQPHDDPERFRAMGADVIEGAGGRFVSPHAIQAGGRRLEARHAIVATGSRPAVPPVRGLEAAGFTTHEVFFERTRLPASIIVLGGGAVGVELAQACVRLGVETSLVEQEPAVLPREDGEVSERIGRILEREGVRVLSGLRAVAAEGQGGRRALDLVPARPEAGGSPVRVEADEILVAAGRRPNVEELGLEEAGVEVGPAGVLVDERLRTSRSHILAAGDVTGGLLFTHVADHEARTAVRNALFPFPARVDYRGVPRAIFTDPEVGRVGPTEAEARELHGDGIGVYRYDLAELDRTLTDRSAAGMVKLVTDARGRVIAGHIVAPQAGTMIAEVALAVRHRLPVKSLSELVHPYPTMSEGVRRAADAAVRSRLTPRARRWIGRWIALARTLGL